MDEFVQLLRLIYSECHIENGFNHSCTRTNSIVTRVWLFIAFPSGDSGACVGTRQETCQAKCNKRWCNADITKLHTRSKNARTPRLAETGQTLIVDQRDLAGHPGLRIAVRW